MSDGYEPGMKVMFEVRSGTAIVNFRGRMTVLPGPFAAESEAIAAGEAFCRAQGWRPAPARPVPQVTLRSAW
jgi:hypothetical protein